MFEDSWEGELIPKRKGCCQGIGWLWSADFGVGVEHVDILLVMSFDKRVFYSCDIEVFGMM